MLLYQGGKEAVLDNASNLGEKFKGKSVISRIDIGQRKVREQDTAVLGRRSLDNVSSDVAFDRQERGTGSFAGCLRGVA